jgi:hypothetical protein
MSLWCNSPGCPGGQACCHDPAKYVTRGDSHYATPTGVEASDVIDAYGLNFNLGCVVKYVCRCDRKGDPVGDLQKAADYLARELKRRKAG